ncbi:lipocalin-like domain-containing protein [Psychroserpens luteus]|uniref:Lipocalin family protein n=1 Tax=Psychroserpens luteus TaxID=1434066 RepID=A0ABW5ZP31_9FLAO|nr:lipocalin family protein [Psychroserpens luteus]
MKNFIRFYFLFSLITVLFSCSDDNDNQDIIQDNGLTIMRHVESATSNSIAPKTTYVENATNNQLTSYFKHDSSGNIEKLTHIVSDDGSGISTIIEFDGAGAIHSLYQQNGLTGQIFNKVFIETEEGVTYYGGEDGVNQLTESSQMNNVGNFLNSQDDLLFSQAINQNIETLEHFAYVFNNDNNNRSSLNLLVFVIVMAGIAIFYTAESIEQGGQFIPKDTDGMVQCDMFGDCSDDDGNRSSSNAGEISCTIPYTDYVCSEVVELDENLCDNSQLEVIIGVDPGNLLVAIVNGDSTNYDFYWSTGEMSTELIGHSITAPEDGEYYVMVIDDYGCVAFGSATVGSDEPVDAQLLIGPWILIAATENGANIFSTDDCDEVMTFNQTQLTATQFYGETEGDCSMADTVVSNYSIEDGNFLHDTLEGDTDISEILELTGSSLVLESIDGAFTYVETYSKRSIFGDWTFAENSNCVVSNGDTFTDNGSGELLTLNDDYTVVLPDDSNGNYLTNGFTFENDILTINLSYQDFFTPECGGINYQTATNSMSLIYDEATDTFTGTSQSVRNQVTGSECVRYGETCNGTVTLAR